MHLPKRIESNKVFLLLNNLFVMILFILMTMASCGGCGNKNNTDSYTPNIKGNIADIKVNKPELFGAERDFSLSFIAKKDKKTINLTNYRIHVIVTNGQVDYTHFSREEKGRKLHQTQDRFLLSVADFFEKTEFTADEINSAKVNIPFTIIPDSGASWANVILELEKKGKNGNKTKVETTVDWRK